MFPEVGGNVRSWITPHKSKQQQRQMAGRLPDTRRIRVLTARRGAVGEEESLETKGGEEESLEDKVGEEESLETKVGDKGWRRREFGDQNWRTREFGDLGAENERVETWRAEREGRVQKGITEVHRTLDSAVNFGPGEEVPHLGSGAAHRRATSITGTSGTAALGRTSVGSCA